VDEDTDLAEATEANGQARPDDAGIGPAPSGGGPSGGGPGPTPSPAGRPRPRPIFLLVGLVLAGALAIGLFTGVGTRASAGPPQTGSAAPTFSLHKLGGPGTVGTPADGGGNGHPAILLFFASWCAPCRGEIPALAAAYRQAQATGGPLTGVRLIGVDGADPTSDALAFVHASGVTFPVAADADYQVTENLYYFTGDPEAVAITADGQIAHIQRGPITVAQLQAWARQLTTG
jgi:thiol-disulfide isomerase/thioredoxin